MLICWSNKSIFLDSEFTKVLETFSYLEEQVLFLSKNKSLNWTFEDIKETLLFRLKDWALKSSNITLVYFVTTKFNIFWFSNLYFILCRVIENVAYTNCYYLTMSQTSVLKPIVINIFHCVAFILVCKRLICQWQQNKCILQTLWCWLTKVFKL